MRKAAPAVAVAAFLPGSASAHTVVTPYDLPIPFHDYAYACAATIVLTFAVLLVVPPGARTNGPVRSAWRIPSAVVWALRAFAILLLTFAIVVGWLGAQSPVSNPAPFLVWTAIMLGRSG